MDFFLIGLHSADRVALLALSGALALPPLGLLYLGDSHEAKELFVVAFELSILVPQLIKLFRHAFVCLLPQRP